MPQVVYEVSADVDVTARRVAEAQARSQGWRNVTVLFVRRVGDRRFSVTLLVS